MYLQQPPQRLLLLLLLLPSGLLPPAAPAHAHKQPPQRERANARIAPAPLLALLVLASYRPRTGRRGMVRRGPRFFLARLCFRPDVAAAAGVEGGRGEEEDTEEEENEGDGAREGGCGCGCGCWGVGMGGSNTRPCPCPSLSTVVVVLWPQRARARAMWVRPAAPKCVPRRSSVCVFFGGGGVREGVEWVGSSVLCIFWGGREGREWVEIRAGVFFGGGE